MVIYYDAKNFHSTESLVRLIDSKHSLANLFIGRPTKLMGNSGIIELKDISKDRSIKIEGSFGILEEIYEKLVSK